MDDKLRRRPLMHVVDRVVLFERLLRLLFPGTTTPFMVELCSLSDEARMSDMITHKEKLVRRISIVSRVKDAIVAHKSLEIEPILGMTLDPAVPRVSTWRQRRYVYDSLDGVATPAGARCN
jgi:hypothetical protein